MAVTLETILGSFRNYAEFSSCIDSFLKEYDPNVQRSIKKLLSCLRKTPTLAPSIKAEDAEGVIIKWVNKYINGYNRRISVRESNFPRTIPDPVINFIIKSRYGAISDSELEQIKFAHQLSMSAENILGLLLEEFLSERLSIFGWHCCWGETIRSVDFCHDDGRLLQIKNRSNSENSSSDKVRIGTKITKWYRVDARTGIYQWEKLSLLVGGGEFCEEDFRRFIKKTIKANPAALAVEDDNRWVNRKG